ncbi:MAG: tRNA uridine-5-carboxymethylaminomethyl(34) synthesis enzyme MnmG [Chitinispirillales bacterium]|jgi:tRNA uridine 5-carboxymethylaminomethyl modification enzyme|nr:tRNA uridine-5-carboxymethylaminomethyl(34) synthesis enzyme MnmG [Chitinispirillales bacterium]
MRFDVVVIGGGHAGIEAAWIAAKRNVSVLLITSHIDFIGQMPCNPAIGGVAKGNIVREIGALGGLMASLIDRSGIHFRLLNRSKGTAVWGPRAQADKDRYKKFARHSLENHPNITILQAMVTKLNVFGEQIRAVILDNGQIIHAETVILAAGTFLNGIIHVGLNSFGGGRAGEPSSSGLTENIRQFGISSGRLSTGTPPRIDSRTIDYSKLIPQHGDDDPWPFSFFTKQKLINRITCWTAKTNRITHQHIIENKGNTFLYSGKTAGAYPRYCPSIEDKVVRFGERDGHTLFLEPETLEHQEVYINGFSTSLPFDIQEKMVRSIEGLENTKILRPGYGIEYDYFQPLQLKSTLESKAVKNLFFAGQVNGTSGYEEAACQGLIAGINAVQNIKGDPPVVLSRDSSYTGVLIDDLVTKGTDEPYRMFTSRAEHRLLLRQDNCDERLMPLAYKLGTVTQGEYDERQRFWDKKRSIIEWLYSIKISPEAFYMATGGNIQKNEIAGDLLKRPEVGFEEILKGVARNVPVINEAEDIPQTDRFLTLGIESDIKYEGFVRKQFNEIEKLRRFEDTKIPVGFCYDDIPGLLTESREKLIKISPDTLGKASRIGGVTPADISVLAMYLMKKNL